MPTDTDRFASALGALGDSLASAEAVIQALKLGVSAEVPLDAEEIEPRLAYGHVSTGKKRTLHLRRGDAVETLASQSLAVRCGAARAVPRLVDALRARRAGRATEIQASADRLEAYLDELNHDGTD
jgi:hypothetical protein